MEKPPEPTALLAAAMRWKPERPAVWATMDAVIAPADVSVTFSAAEREGIATITGLPADALATFVEGLERAVSDAIALRSTVQRPTLREVKRALRPTWSALLRGQYPTRQLRRLNERHPHIAAQIRRRTPDATARAVEALMRPTPPGVPQCIPLWVLAGDLVELMSKAGLRVSSYDDGLFVELLGLCREPAGIPPAAEGDHSLAKKLLRRRRTR